MRGLELVVVLGVAVLVCSLVARRYRVAPPVLLFGCGVLLGFISAGRICHRRRCCSSSSQHCCTGRA
jgi:monovalent cation/hydrogen antiporter